MRSSAGLSAHQEDPVLPDPGFLQLRELAGPLEGERFGVAQSRPQPRDFRVPLARAASPRGPALAQLRDQRLALVGVDLGFREPRLEQRALLDALGHHMPQLFDPQRDASVVDCRAQRARGIVPHELAHLAQVVGIEVGERLAGGLVNSSRSPEKLTAPS